MGLACPVAENSVAVRPCCGSRSRSEGGGGGETMEGGKKEVGAERRVQVAKNPANSQHGDSSDTRAATYEL